MSHVVLTFCGDRAERRREIVWNEMFQILALADDPRARAAAMMWLALCQDPPQKRTIAEQAGVSFQDRGPRR